LGEIKEGFSEGLASVEDVDIAVTRGKKRSRRSNPDTPTNSPLPPARLTSKHPVADAILAYDPVSLGRPDVPATHIQYAASQGLAAPNVRTEGEHANAFLFGVISDRMIKAEKAWALPYELSKRIGHLEVRKIAKMEVVDVTSHLENPTKLHRFNKATATAFITASRHLVDKQGGVASNMWKPGTSAVALLQELEALPGISHKLSSMTLQILITRMGVDIRGVASVNIAVDRHVARVFLRTGLVDGCGSRKVYRSAELKPGVIEAARAASPRFPGALDFGAFWIGKNWCTHQAPRCSECPITSACPKKRRGWAVGTEKNGKLAAE